MAAKTVLIYGPPHSGKSFQIYLAAKYLWEKHQKKTRLVTADLGGYEQIQDSGLIESGAVDVLDMSTGDTFMHNMLCLSLGFWPTSNGTLERIPKCQTNEHFGLYAFEGITSLADRYLQYMRESTSAHGFKKAISIKDGNTTIAGLSEGHYGIAQNEIYRWISNTRSLNSDYVIWTAHSNPQAVKGQNYIYPKAAGDALSPKIPSWFGNVFFLDTVRQESENSVTEKRVLWYQEHYDETLEARVPATMRLIDSVMYDWEEKYSEGYLKTGRRKDGTFKGLIDYLEEYKELARK